MKQTVAEPGKTRLEQYAEQVEDGATKWPKGVKYLLVDGFYTKRTFVDSVCGANQGLDLVGKTTP